MPTHCRSTGIHPGADWQNHQRSGALAGYRLYRQAAGQPTQVVAEIQPTEVGITVGKGLLNLDQGNVNLFRRAVDKYGNESPDSDPLRLGASLNLASATAGESNCFVSIVNGWQYCDITAALSLNDQASQTPATFRSVLASSDEGASVALDLSSTTAQLGFTDFMVNMEHRDTYPFLTCGINPDGAMLPLPYNHGAFTPPGKFPRSRFQHAR